MVFSTEDTVSDERRDRRERRRAQQQRREQQRPQRRKERRQAPTAAGFASAGPVEFPGIMGWMQRNSRWLFLGGIVVLVLSMGAGVIALNSPTPEAATPTPAATATETAEATATAEATPTEDAITRNYAAPPEMTIDPTKTYEAVFTTSKGSFTVTLDAENAPSYTNNFVFLAENEFFDGLTFHRVLEGFVAQGGDPEGTGFGGPGYVLPQETNSLPFEEGIISMAASAAGVSGSQFFITLAPQPGLEGDFTAFGRVTSGMNVVKALTLRDPSQPNQPAPDVIQSVTITEK
ncbi:MAG: peptidylprolyl isomerase [Dehalococcoidia bacterium]|nr:peptidylprolyl isomerase [Dehalococcoidia bacterium]